MTALGKLLVFVIIVKLNCKYHRCSVIETIIGCKLLTGVTTKLQVYH